MAITSIKTKDTRFSKRLNWKPQIQDWRALDWQQYYHHGNEIVEGYLYARINVTPPIKIKGRWNAKVIKISKTIPWHRDWSTKCAINTVLNKDLSKAGHFEINNEKHWYRSAILDVTKKHRAVVYDEPRLIIKISIFDEDYETICERFASQFM